MRAPITAAATNSMTMPTAGTSIKSTSTESANNNSLLTTIRELLGWHKRQWPWFFFFFCGLKNAFNVLFSLIFNFRWVGMRKPQLFWNVGSSGFLDYQPFYSDSWPETQRRTTPRPRRSSGRQRTSLLRQMPSFSRPTNSSSKLIAN